MEGRHSQRGCGRVWRQGRAGWRRALTWWRASEVPAVRVHRLQEEVAHGQDDGGLQPRAPRQAPRCAHLRPGPRGHQQGELQPQQRGSRDSEHGRRLSARQAGEGPERRAPGDTRGRVSALSRPARAVCAPDAHRVLACTFPRPPSSRGSSLSEVWRKAVVVTASTYFIFYYMIVFYFGFSFCEGRLPLSPVWF